MFKKTMKFDDLDGNEVEQTFYFNFNKKEIAELIEFGAIQKFAVPGKQYLPLEEALTKLSTPTEESGLSQVENNKQAYAIFEDLILDAYGEKGADNVSFVKTPELREYWSNHVAYVELIFEFLANPTEASKFIENCLPAKMVARAKEEMQAEAQGKLSSSTLHEMVEEANRRQQDPATRIEPGLKAAQEAGVAPTFETVTTSDQASQKKPEDLTADDVMVLSDEDFAKLNVQKLSREAMLAAFQRKNQA